MLSRGALKMHDTYGDWNLIQCFPTYISWNASEAVAIKGYKPFCEKITALITFVQAFS